MAFYQNRAPKKVTKEQHLERAFKKDDEGYNKSRSTGSRFSHSSSQGQYGSSNYQNKDSRFSNNSNSYNRDGKPSYNRDGQSSFSRDGQRPFNRDNKPAYNRDGQSSFSRDGQRPFNRDSKPAYNREGQSSFSRDGQRPFNRDSKPAYNRDGQKTFDRNGQRPYNGDRRENSFSPRPIAPAPVQTEQTFVKQYDTPFTQEPENLLSGRNPIREALKAGRDIEKMLVQKGELSGSAREIVMMAKDMHIPVQVVEKARLDEITKNHQGMLAYASAYQYADVESMFALAEERNEEPFIVVLDGITDPHNLGAIIRTAACVGAHGIIVPERRAVGLTPAAVKASAGAIETVKVARVTNLTRTLDSLKEKGLWMYAASMEGEDYRTVKMDGPVCLIIGSEGEGISRLVLKQADHLVKLPMHGGVQSLNASVAAGVLMYAIMSFRN